MATAVKRGDSYKITASCGYDISGKQIRKHTTWTPPAGMTPRQIAKELERQKVLFEERVNSGTTKDGNIRFEDFAAIWMKDFAQKQLKVKTYTGYEKSLVRINQAIGHIKLKDLRTGHLNEFYRNLEETGIRADLKYTSKIDIGEAIEQAGVTRTAFGKAAGVAGNTLRIAISGKRVSKETATAISEELGLKLSDAFRLEQPDRLLSSNTVRSYHRIISSCLGKAVKWGYIPYNPAVNAELPKMPKQEAAYLDEAEARQLLVLLHQEPIKYRAMITFDLLSGLRRGELLGLRWQDVDFENQTITIVNTLNYAPGAGVYVDTPKNTTSARPLKLSPTAFSMLLEYKRWQDDQRDACGADDTGCDILIVAAVICASQDIVVKFCTVALCCFLKLFLGFGLHLFHAGALELPLQATDQQNVRSDTKADHDELLKVQRGVKKKAVVGRKEKRGV